MTFLQNVLDWKGLIPSVKKVIEWKVLERPFILDPGEESGLEGAHSLTL